MNENTTKSDINLNLNELNRKLEESKKEGQKKFELRERLHRERLKKLQEQEDIVMAEKRDYYEKEEETRTRKLKI